MKTTKSSEVAIANSIMCTFVPRKSALNHHRIMTKAIVRILVKVIPCLGHRKSQQAFTDKITAYTNNIDLERKQLASLCP